MSGGRCRCGPHVDSLGPAIDRRHSQPADDVAGELVAGVEVELADGRRKNAPHEARWLNLTGFCLRPGFGFPGDDFRIEQARRIYAGGITFGTRHWTLPRHRLLPWLLFANALLVVPVLLSGALVTVLAACFFAGICLAPVFSSLSSLIGEHAPPGGTARAFTWNTAAIVIGASIGSAVCGALISSAGLDASLAVAGGSGRFAYAWRSATVCPAA